MSKGKAAQTFGSESRIHSMRYTIGLASLIIVSACQNDELREDHGSMIRCR